MNELEVTCAHCGATNTIAPPADHTGALKWECRPCGGVCEIRIGPEPDVDEQTITDADVAVLDSDGGTAGEAAG